MFDILPAPLDSIFAFIIVLGVLVFIHELGHYLAARACGVHAEVFSIGFGRTIVSWIDRRGTVWRVAWLPLGGYVRMHGMEHRQDVPPEVSAQWLPGRTFQEKSVAARAVIIAAGPVANFLLAAVLFSALFGIVGRPVAAPPGSADIGAVIGEVVPGSAAARAGVAVGDRVLAIDGRPVNRFEDLQRAVSAAPGRPLALRIERKAEELNLTATPDSRETGGQTVGLLGVRSTAAPTVFEPVGPLTAVVAGVEKTWDVTAQTLTGLWQMITRQRGTEELGGPLRIAQLSGQVAQLGLVSLVSFIAVLSVNLALINLFPIPILDGGHLVFLTAEAVRGRPLPRQAQEYGMRAGLAVILALFVFATWNDLGQLGLFRWVSGLGG